VAGLDSLNGDRQVAANYDVNVILLINLQHVIRSLMGFTILLQRITTLQMVYWGKYSLARAQRQVSPEQIVESRSLTFNVNPHRLGTKPLTKRRFEV